MRFASCSVLWLRALVALGLAGLTPQVFAQANRLKPGKTVQKDFSGGQAHVYTVKLKADHYLFASVAQLNPSVVVDLSGPDGKKLLEVDTRDFPGKPARIFWVAEAKGEYRISLSGAGHYEIQLKEIRKAGPVDRKRAEAERLFAQGLSQGGKEAYDPAIPLYLRALVLFSELHDQEREIDTLLVAGMAYTNTGHMQNAIDFGDRALALAREIKDHRDEAAALNNLAIASAFQSQYEKAIDYFTIALAIARELHDRALESRVLTGLGNGHLNLGQFQKAIDYYEQALAIFRSLNDRIREGAILTNLGTAYFVLSQYQKAVDYFEHGLEIAREFNNRAMEGRALGGLGGAYAELGQYDRSIECDEKALPIFRELKDPLDESSVLGELGISYITIKQYEKAIGYEEQALAIKREIGQRSGEGEVLTNLGTAYDQLGEHARAVDYYQQAISISREVKDRRIEILELSGLMEAWQASNQPRLAIFYGKQAVNTVQSMRSDIASLSQDLQESFLKGNEKPYHTLAELLIAQGRLAEAEQVLALLKEEEYFEYVRRDAGEGASLNRRADLTPDEAEYEKRYHEIGDRLMTIGAQRGDLLAKKTLTADDSQHLMQLEQDLAVGNQAFEHFLGDLTQHFSAKPELNAKVVEQLREEEGFMEDLRELPAGTVAIYTLAGDDKFHAILRTPDAQKAYEYPIKAAELNRKIFAFREAVGDPKIDPRPLAQELYQILLAPMAEDLRQAKAQTLMWSLDGALRYVPIAALYDGKQYLIEQYRVSVMTLASTARLKDRPDSAWSAAGFGVTKKHDDNPALPEVAAELRGVEEILHGEIKLDEQFTEASMRATLVKRFPVVHIASHFRFMPGDQSKSFLLLGDGGHLSLAELKTLPNLFSGVQLLTLSACNTGVGDGTEVEGFGTLAQRQGAKAVVASLWPVADASTSRLMQEFYRIRETSSGMPKLEALREAQLELLRGTSQSKTDAPYSHPFYWAPFFLMGNWL